MSAMKQTPNQIVSPTPGAPVASPRPMPMMAPRPAPSPQAMPAPQPMPAPQLRPVPQQVPAQTMPQQGMVPPVKVEIRPYHKFQFMHFVTVKRLQVS